MAEEDGPVVCVGARVYWGDPTSASKRGKVSRGTKTQWVVLADTDETLKFRKDRLTQIGYQLGPREYFAPKLVVTAEEEIQRAIRRAKTRSKITEAMLPMEKRARLVTFGAFRLNGTIHESDLKIIQGRVAELDTALTGLDDALTQLGCMKK